MITILIVMAKAAAATGALVALVAILAAVGLRLEGKALTFNPSRRILRRIAWNTFVLWLCFLLALAIDCLAGAAPPWHLR